MRSTIPQLQYIANPTLYSCLYHTINILLHRPILCSRERLKSHPESHDSNHLVQCMASATSILSLFDLYRRTFGDSHVVLSLAYSIYTAASIFLLEIQALKYAAPGTLDKLKFCIFALERVKAANPVITTALNLISLELQRLQINIHGPITTTAAGADPAPHTQHTQPLPPPHSYPTQPQHSQSPSVGSSSSRHVSPSRHHHQPQSSIDTQAQTTRLDNPTLMPTYSAFQHPGAGFNIPQTGEMPQMPPTHLLRGMPNAAMTMDDLNSYEITPEVYEAFSYAQPITTNMTPAYEQGWSGPR